LAQQGPGSDVRALPGLLNVAAQGAPIRLVLADAEFDSEPNHQHIRQRLGARSGIPAKRRGIPPTPSAIRCTLIFRKTVPATRQGGKPSFRWSNASSPRAPRGAAWPRRSAGLSASALPTISITWASTRAGGCQQSHHYLQKKEVGLPSVDTSWLSSVPEKFRCSRFPPSLLRPGFLRSAPHRHFAN